MGDPIAEFDIIGFSLGYEMAYTNVLNMLDLAGLPLRSEDRKDLRPLVVAGGTSMYNPEPLAPFVDIVSLGEGEDVTVEMIQLYRKAKQEGWSKAQLCWAAAQIPGLYIPSLYEISYREDGLIASILPQEGAPERVKKADCYRYGPVLLSGKNHCALHGDHTRPCDAGAFRGCIRGCRFCQAGFVYRPVRSRSQAQLARQGIEACQDSGYQDMTLMSLSSSDYPDLLPLCDALLEWCEPHKVNLALPSLRADNFSMNLMEKLQRGGRKSGLTFAPEAGSQRLRDAINKNVTEEDLLNSCRTAFAGGWSGVKLYFMLGLPTETDEDVLGIADLANKVYHVWRNNTPTGHVGCGLPFRPLVLCPNLIPHFSGRRRIQGEEYLRKVTLLRENLRNKSITYNWHDPETSFLEAALSRGTAGWRM